MVMSGWIQYYLKSTEGRAGFQRWMNNISNVFFAAS